MEGLDHLHIERSVLCHLSKDFNGLLFVFVLGCRCVEYSNMFFRVNLHTRGLPKHCEHVVSYLTLRTQRDRGLAFFLWQQMLVLGRALQRKAFLPMRRERERHNQVLIVFESYESDVEHVWSNV